MAPRASSPPPPLIDARVATRAARGDPCSEVPGALNNIPATAEIDTNGKIERIEIVQEWRKDGKAKLKTPKLTTIFRPHVAQPKIQGRHVKVTEGKRHERRPSAIARAGGKRQITEVEWADEYDQFSDWSEPDEDMPDEYEESLGEIMVRPGEMWARCRRDIDEM